MEKVKKKKKKTGPITKYILFFNTWNSSRDVECTKPLATHDHFIILQSCTLLQVINNCPARLKEEKKGHNVTRALELPAGK